MPKDSKTISVRYFAILREESQKSDEEIATAAATVRALYQELKERYHFSLPLEHLKVAVNDTVQSWDTPLNDRDSVVFLPPVSGG